MLLWPRILVAVSWTIWQMPFVPPSPSASKGCVIFWPSTRPKMPFRLMHRKEVTHSNGNYERKSRRRKLADEMGRGKKKFPWYTHRLTHRKRVTSELHDSYFRLTTIQHWISKIEWAIEWSLNYDITQSRQKSSGSSSWVGDGEGRGVVGKATSGRRSLWGPWWVPVTVGDGVIDEMQSLSSRELGCWASGWASGEWERHNVDGHKSGGQNIAISVRSPAPSHSKTPHNPFEPLQ